ncbi:MAG: hypothetical protein ACKO96_30990, partial [Flammeovirgaceae bacterium]
MTAMGGLAGAAPSIISSSDTDIQYTATSGGGQLFVFPQLVTTRWKTDSDGNWDDAANWSRGHVPRAGEDVVIARGGSGNPTVTIGEGLNATANSIQLNSSDRLYITESSTLT